MCVCVCVHMCVQMCNNTITSVTGMNASPTIAQTRVRQRECIHLLCLASVCLILLRLPSYGIEHYT